MSGPLTGGFAEQAGRRLASSDAAIAAYSVAHPDRQPVHTVYLPADRFDGGTVAAWGSRALTAADDVGGVAGLAEIVGLDPALADRVTAKLQTEPIEDLRVDFEDGYGNREDRVEDHDVVAAARTVAAWPAQAGRPPFVGIRFKSFESDTRRRGLRSLELFVLTLGERGELPSGLRLTLPKVSTVDQVAVMVDACAALEAELGLPAGGLRFEVQVETPQIILAADGTCPLPAMIQRSSGRISGLHYGTYDYSDALDIAATNQSMDHPAADHAKAVMQLAVARTGVALSDGSTNILPVGDLEHRRRAWQLHARLVRRSLDRGFYQGWDLHPAQLPTRFLATYSFYRQGFPVVADRLRVVLQSRLGEQAQVADEPATIRPLARFVHRGVRCGAIDRHEVERDIGVSIADLISLARPAAGRPNPSPGAE